MSLGASNATQKKLTNKCSFYRVPLLAVEADTASLAKAVGKTGDLAAVAVMDENFARELSKIHAGRKESPTVGDEG
jgi:ribosomal protein L7Ae-like RNA K-turn-binding protein